jgi:hypothetical protein
LFRYWLDSRGFGQGSDEIELRVGPSFGSDASTEIMGGSSSREIPGFVYSIYSINKRALQ